MPKASSTWLKCFWKNGWSTPNLKRRKKLQYGQLFSTSLRVAVDRSTMDLHGSMNTGKRWYLCGSSPMNWPIQPICWPSLAMQEKMLGHEWRIWSEILQQSKIVLLATSGALRRGVILVCPTKGRSSYGMSCNYTKMVPSVIKWM